MAKKYIDADLLRKEIEKERKNIEGLFTEGDNSFYDGQDDAHNHTLALIDSLQQKQQEFVKEIWHKISEEANLTRPVVLSDGDKYMSPPCTFPFKDMSGFVKAMNKKYKADYTIWAYMDDLLNISSLQQEQQEVDLEKEYEQYVTNDPVYSKLVNSIAGMAIARHFYELGKNSK